MRRPLFVANEDMADRVLVIVKHVIDRQDCAAGIAENDVDSLILQGFDHHFGTGHYSGHFALRHFHAGFCNFGQ